MKRTRFDSEYDKVRKKAGLAQPQYEFPDDEEIERDRAERQARIEASMVEFRERMSANDRLEDEARAIRAAKFDAKREEWTERFLRREWAAFGLEPPTPLVSVDFALTMGWRIEEIEGEMRLIRPMASRAQPRKRREDYDQST